MLLCDHQVGLVGSTLMMCGGRRVQRGRGGLVGVPEEAF